MSNNYGTDSDDEGQGALQNQKKPNCNKSTREIAYYIE